MLSNLAVSQPASLPEAASAGGSAGFVFGQNLRDRAVANPVTVPEDVPPGSTNGDATADSTEAASEGRCGGCLVKSLLTTVGFGNPICS